MNVERKKMFDQKAYMKTYYLAHSEQAKGRSKAWRLAHPEYNKTWKLAHSDRVKVHNENRKLKKSEYRKAYMKEYNKAYRIMHGEQKKKYDKEWKLEHSEHIKATSKIYYSEHSDQINAKIKVYQQTQKGKEIKRKTKAIRKQFGFIPLNDWFAGSEGHHIDKERVIYIPKELHQGIGHSVSQNRNMEEINKIAFGYIDRGNL